MDRGTRRWGVEAIWALSSAAIALLCACWVLKVWQADLSIPLRYLGPPSDVSRADHLFVLQLSKGICENGSPRANPRLGAPEGLFYADFPLTEQLHFLFLRGLSLVSSSAGFTTNAYFLLGFPLAALCAYVALRMLGVEPLLACGAGVLYSLLPYHFMRGLDHLFLASYYPVPLGIVVVVWIWQGAPLVRERRLTAKGWGAILIGLVIGAAGIYYAAYTAFFLVVGAICNALRRRRTASLAGCALPVGAIAVVLLLQLAPTVAERFVAGANPSVALRDPQETEVYALKITQLLVPIREHRLVAFASLSDRYGSAATHRNENTTAALCVIGSVGFLSLLAWVCGVRLRNQDPHLMRVLATCNIVAVLYATVGGFAMVSSVYFSPMLRSANRMSIFIAFFSLAAGCVMASSYLKSFRSRFAAIALVGLVTVMGVLDQTSPRFAPDYAQISRAWQQDQQFFTRVEASLPAGSSVFQLPYVAFPEGGPADYQNFRGYLHSKALRWSFGAMRGRSCDAWQKATASLEPQRLVSEIRGRGFSGICIDRACLSHYADTEAGLAKLLGNPLVSGDSRFSFYSCLGGAAR